MNLNYFKNLDDKHFFSYLIYLFPLFFLLGPGIINSVKIVLSLYGFYIIFFVKKNINLKNKKIYVILLIFFSFF